MTGLGFNANKQHLAGDYCLEKVSAPFAASLKMLFCCFSSAFILQHSAFLWRKSDFHYGLINFWQSKTISALPVTYYISIFGATRISFFLSSLHMDVLHSYTYLTLSILSETFQFFTQSIMRKTVSVLHWLKGDDLFLTKKNIVFFIQHKWCNRYSYRSVSLFLDQRLV